MLRAVALCAAAWPWAAGAVETMRIAVSDGAEQVQVSARLLSMGPDADEGAFRVIPNGRGTVRRAGRGLEVDGAPVVGEAVRFRAGAWALDAGMPGQEPVRAGALEVRGDVVVRLHGSALQVVNVLPLEDYLVGVLGSEMPPQFPLEALKAQAVAARTYALQKKLEAPDDPAHLGSGVLSQVYGGLSREDDRTREAVRATRGEVLTYELAPIEAYFHASCGGRTESGLDALNRDLPYLKPVDCPCAKQPASRWELTVPFSEVQALTGAHDLRSLAVASRTETGRARRVALGGGRSTDAVTFRQRLGYQRLKSLSFDISPAPGGMVRFSGHGFGHGAGLCQWGAKELAEEGWDYRRILAHYYPGTELQTLY
ncbi:MAG TPA: SpoIID/LytB domain-containing protein [Myxococcaceae bacterium]|nr:SpoIID/LytB domain-containing protein [Myxococcaceae bacterium]